MSSKFPDLVKFILQILYSTSVSGLLPAKYVLAEFYKVCKQPRQRNNIIFLSFKLFKHGKHIVYHCSNLNYYLGYLLFRWFFHRGYYPYFISDSCYRNNLQPAYRAKNIVVIFNFIELKQVFVVMNGDLFY